MKALEDRIRHDLLADLGGQYRIAWHRDCLAQSLVRWDNVEVILDILPENPAQVSLAEHENMVKALPSHRALLSSLSRIRYLGASPNGVSSRSC